MSEYRLYLSNRLKSFVTSYSSKLGSTSLLGEKVYLVVQNRSIGEWLKLELAEHQGISANLNIVLPENAVRTFIRSFPLGRSMLRSPDGDGEKAVLFMDNLKVIIYKKLEELLRTDSPETGISSLLYKELENYIKGPGAGEKDYETINSLRLYQLSDSIAGLFYYYGMNCQSLTASWERGEHFFDENSDSSLRKHENWQMALWNELFTETSPYIHLSSILSSIVERDDCYDGDPIRIVLFGSAFMGDSSLRFFRHLSRYVDIDHFILSPAAKSGPYDSPLLRSWGALYEGFSALMDSLTLNHHEPVAENFTTEETTSLLAEIQKNLLNDRIPDSKIPIIRDDKSLTVISTTGRWREVEALKNRIVNLLDGDDKLKLTDIGVLAPDINEYAHYIEAVFPSEDSVSLPYNIIDLKGEGDSPFISGFLSLLNLAGARFTRKELFSLFSNRCFARKQSISSNEYSSWLNLCDQVNIKWAVDEDHKRELNIPGSSYNSWERGFERILEGIALSEEEEPFGAPFELFNESDALSAGKMIHVLRSLHMDINSLTGVKLRLEEWVLLWESIMDSYLAAADDSGRDERDRLRLKGCFRDILNMVNELKNLENYKNRFFDFFMFKSLLAEFINKSGGSRGRYLTQGISCASLKPLRAVPFKVIMVLGLNEESFPAADEALSFDLKESEEVKEAISIDLSRRTSDKYSFLEVFLSAEQRVCLFYTGRNNVDNEVLQPSSLISELAEYINDNFTIEGEEDCFSTLVEQEKLQPFDRAYFSGQPDLYSYSRRDFELAKVYYGQRENPQLTGFIEPVSLDNESDVLEITFGDLLSFLRNPLKHFYNRTCGVFMDEQDLVEEDVDENVEPDFFLQRSFFNDLLLSSEIDESSRVELEDRLDDFSRLQCARGEQIDNELVIPSADKMRDNALNIISQSLEDPILSSKPEPVVFTFGEETDREKNVVRSPVVQLSEDLQVRIKGMLPPLYIYGDKSVVSIGIHSSGDASLRHWLPAYLISRLLPAEILGDKGLNAYLVSPSSSHKLTIFGDDANEDLVEVLRSYGDNLESPLPLYPELAEAMIDKKDPLREYAPNILEQLFLSKWADKESSPSFSYSEFKSCPYRSKAYRIFPQIDENKLSSLFRRVYGQIQDLINKGKEK